MKSVTTERFRKAYERLPAAMKRKAREAFLVWQEEPHSTSLRFKCVHSAKPIYSVRVAFGWRALGIMNGEEMVWFWIGPHAEYDNILKRT